MRNETQVFQQILDFARAREDIRAVTMNGSRANPNAPKDFFQDYDVVCFTSNPRAYVENQSWISTFGELVILQQNDFTEYDLDGCIFLMLFQDGVRIDLAFNPLGILPHLPNDSMTVVLLDKDSKVPPIPPTSDSGYLTLRPSRKEWNEAVNEIFWCSNNVAKGIWRDELPYVKFMFETIIRDALVKVVSWYAASLNDWQINPGYHGKWLKKYLPSPTWDQYRATFAGADYQDIWEALFTALTLTRKIGQELADLLGYAYPLEDDIRTVAYLRHVRSLPPDADSFGEISPHPTLPQHM